MTTPLLELVGIRKAFSRGGRPLPALREVSLTLAPAETLALVGPSGSGKSTLARIAMRLIEPDAGVLRFEGNDLLALHGSRLRAVRPKFQMVFQDPQAAFNPRATVGRIIADPLRIHGIARRADRADHVAALLRRVGLPPELALRRIHEISGGQRQRVAIARAIATRPSLIVLDEAVSALDVTVRGQILDLLADLQATEKIAYVFISHDLAVVRAVAHRVAIMDAGSIVETGDARQVIAEPASPVGRALVAAMPRLPRSVTGENA